ncbi:MAG: response regulator transcription factor [Azonexaceae bacterium]|uniref:response regulator n=1 Tax=Azonexus sp. R2A61 TaxID=2744443 RepID=UPI001F271DA8|nr:response regulator transcription factor [Azonexus sp. R2A61]MCE1238628.1 response regulator transcription factor [Azonexaceae bacterium]
MDTARIVLADDQLLIRAGIRALLDSLSGYRIIAECSDGQSAIAAVQQYHPDIVLLDIAMPGMSGIDVARTLRAGKAEARLLILSSIEQPTIVEQALASGVDGYLLKDFLLEELQEALRTVAAGNTYLSPKIRRIVESTASREDQLTGRQLQVLKLVASGSTTKEIARDLRISPKTVEFHRARLMERLGVHDVTGLTRYAMQNGLLD